MFFNLLTDAADPNQPKSNPWVVVIFIVLIVAMIGFLVWSTISGKKKQREAQNMLNGLKKGDRVKTIGGVCGFVVEINDAENTFVLETGTDDKKSYVKFDKGAIYQTAPAQGNAVEAENSDYSEEPLAAEPAEEKLVKKTRKKSSHAE